MSKKILLTGIITLSAVASGVIIPKITDKAVTQEITKNLKLLKNNGVEIKIISKNGYINGERKFKGSITNGYSFLLYLSENIKNEEYKKQVIDKINENENDINQLLNGTEFEGIIQNNNLGMDDISIDFDITSISKLEELKKQPEKNKVIIDFIENKVLGGMIILNNNGELKTFKLKDINKNATSNNHTLDFNLNNVKLSKNKDGYFIFNIDKFYVNITPEDLNNKSEKINISISKLNTLINLKGNSYFNLSELSSTLIMPELSYEMNLSNISLIQNIIVKQEITDFISKNKIGNISYSSSLIPGGKAFIENLNFDIDILNINTTSFDKIKNISNNKSLLTEELEKELTMALERTFNKGLKLNLNIGFDKISGMGREITDIYFDNNFIISENNLTENNFEQEVTNYLTYNGNLKINNNSMKMILPFAGPAGEDIFKKAKIEGDNSIFEVQFKDKKLTLNGEELNL